MSAENIDDLFRQQLGNHETPPGDDLWARLQAGPGGAAPAPEPQAPTSPRLDQLFQHRLHAHATPPPREIWERLEDEHLRPRRRRAAAWWPMALAAAVALLLLAGGAGLWRGFSGGAGPTGTVASRAGREQAGAQANFPNHDTQPAHAGTSAAGQPATTAAKTAAAAAAESSAASSQSVAQASEAPVSGFHQKNLPARATRPHHPASSAPKVGMLAQQSPRRPPGASRQPDAAATMPAPLAARPTAPRHLPTPPQPADEPAPAPVVATTALPVPTPAPAPEIVPAVAPSSATLAAASLITVDVRNGAARRPSLAATVASAAAAPARLGLGGRLLRQVGHAVRGERLSLAEVTGLPETLTLDATIAGRHVSKSIQL